MLKIQIFRGLRLVISSVMMDFGLYSINFRTFENREKMA